MSLPIIGEIKAQGLSTADLATEIDKALQSKVGLATKPDASVQIEKYRPFYVLGAVQRPGQLRLSAWPDRPPGHQLGAGGSSALKAPTWRHSSDRQSRVAATCGCSMPSATRSWLVRHGLPPRWRTRHR